jgi:hypothetical protein
MAVDPVSEICGHSDPVVVDVLAPVGLDPVLVAGGLGGFLGGEAADPPGLADSCLRVLDADYIGSGVPPLHDAVAEPGGVLAWSLPAAGLVGGCGGRGFGHYAAVLSARSLETYASRAVRGMRRDPSMRIDAIAPLASSS